MTPSKVYLKVHKHALTGEQRILQIPTALQRAAVRSKAVDVSHGTRTVVCAMAQVMFGTEAHVRMPGVLKQNNIRDRPQFHTTSAQRSAYISQPGDNILKAAQHIMHHMTVYFIL